MARPREFDEQTVLRAAQGAFRARGYAGTSLQDLMDATQLGKGSLYAAFGDKRGLYLRVLRDYAQQGAAGMGRELAQPRAIEALRAHLLAQAEASQDAPSCLLASATAELAGVDSEVGECVQTTFAELQTLLVDAVARAQAEGDVDPAADAEALGGLLLAVSRGLEALGRGGVPHATLVRTVDAALAGLPGSPYAG